MDLQLQDGPTRGRVARSILVNGPSTAAALAERLHLTPAAVRRHLDQLVDEGTVESREPRSVPGPGQTRGRGRPARLFALTDTGRDSFDQRYDDLAVEALRFLSDTAGEDAVRDFARRRVAFVEERFARVVEERPGIEPAEALAVVLTDEGYAASVRTSPVGEQLCQQHCPVSHVAHEFPQLCEAETEAIGRVLGSHVQRLATIAHGDGVCTTFLPGSPKAQRNTPAPARVQPERPAKDASAGVAALVGTGPASASASVAGTDPRTTPRTATGTAPRTAQERKVVR